MRAMMLAVLMMVTGRETAWGQVSGARQAILEMANTERDVTIAMLCQLRIFDWYRGHVLALEIRATTMAQASLDQFGSSAAQASEFIGGAQLAAEAAAHADYDRYGAIACREIQTSGRLAALDAGR